VTGLSALHHQPDPLRVAYEWLKMHLTGEFAGKEGGQVIDNVCAIIVQ
jgi:hypothetical protein